MGCLKFASLGLRCPRSRTPSEEWPAQNQINDPVTNNTILAQDEVIGRERESSVIFKITWRIVPLLFVLYLVAYLDRINVAFGALQMQRQLHFSDTVWGLI
jgi:hypothetical protein